MTYNEIVRQYEDDVLSGKICAGRLERLAVERQRRDLETGSARGLYFDHKAGSRILKFFSILNLGPDQPFELQPWQQFELYVFYGWRRSDGRRRFSRKYKSVSRKNGKTPLESGQILYHLTVENLFRAEAYVSATKELQAKIAFDDAKFILQYTPELQDYLESTSTTIFNRENGAKFQFLTSSPKTADGTRPSFYVIDEYHEFDNDDMLTKLQTGTIHRKEPIANIVTTRGSRTTTPCFTTEERLYIPILEGVIEDDSTFVYIFSQDEEDEFDKPETWRKSNPMLGSILELDKLLADRANAVLKGEEHVVKFKTLNLNMWCNAAKSFIPDEKWMQSGTDFPAEMLAGRQCWGGLDMASRDDFCAFSLHFPPTDSDPVHRALWWFWIPNWKFDNRVQNGLHTLRDWVKAGHITVIEGEIIDPNQIRDTIKYLGSIYNIASLAYDKYNATGIALELDAHGIPAFEFPQTMPHFTGPTKEYRNLVMQGQYDHGRNPVVRWMMKNAVVITDTNENIRITKDHKRAPDKVDGIISAIMALGCWQSAPEAETPQIFFR